MSNGITKILVNKIYIKEQLFTIRMANGTHIHAHLDEFNSTLPNLEKFKVEINDEDKAMLLGVIFGKRILSLNLKELVIIVLNLGIKFLSVIS